MSTIPAFKTESGMVITPETLLTATCGQETLLIRLGDGKASLAIDENDNGNVISAQGDKDLLVGLCAALTHEPVEDLNESRTSTLPSEPEAVVELSANSSGYTLTISAISERSRRVQFSYEGGDLLRKAISGTFDLWDL